MLSRERAIQTLSSEQFDVAVIGGGITGAGVALDAASRGYSVALVEKADFASGTSSRSSKLVHGGLRYLQSFDLGLVREALLERQLMVKLAPHLVRPLEMVVPAFDGARPDRIVGIGLNMYDVMATPRLRGRRSGRRAVENGQSDWSPARHRVIPAEEVVSRLPALERRNPTGGYLFYDCQTDDARLVLTVLGEAERFGAICANQLEVTELLTGDRAGRGIAVRDRESGGEFPVRADSVVNATGVWADRIRPGELHSEAELPTIVPSRGTHVTVSQRELPVRAGSIIPAGRGRSIFALPWLGSTLLGTTDNTYDGDIDHVRPAGEDIEYLLDAANAFFASSLTTADLTGAYAGVRPLISAGDSRKSVDISRKAELYETSSGLITITGGKLTTWRRMAKLAVDRLVERDGREAPCRTHEIPLGAPVDPDALPRVDGVGDASYPALAGSLRTRRPRAPAARRAGRRRRRADRGRPSRPARRGVLRGRPRTGPHRRRRVVQAHPAGAAGGALAAGARRRRPVPSGSGDGRRARLGRGADRARGRPVRRGGANRVPGAGDRQVIAPRRAFRSTRGDVELGGRPWLMGIVNATPDSFSDGDLPRTLDARVALAESLISSGADVIDIGGESGVTNRPAVDPKDEIERVVPLIERIAGGLGALVSVDTYKPPVARAAIAAGAAIVNDVSGLRDPELADVCAETGAGLVLMHTRAAPKQKLLDPSLDGRVVDDVRMLPGRADLPGDSARRGVRAADRRSRAGLRQDAGADGRGDACAGRPARAGPAASAGRLA